LSLSCPANAEHHEILPCATWPPGRVAYTYCVCPARSIPNSMANGSRRIRRYQLLTKNRERFSQFVIAAGYHAASPVCRVQIGDEENTQEMACRHALCARFAPSTAWVCSCPHLVAHAPHKVAGLEGAGIFLSLQGNDMAKCQRTNLDTARSLYSALCPVGNVILRAMYDLSSSTGSQ
jgi:hypothetical protein